MAQEEKAKNLLLCGADAVGQAGTAATGSLIGFILGNSEGAAAGAALGSLLGSGVKAFTDLANRVMSEREQIRLAKSAYYTSIKIKENVAAARSLRQDGFFDETEIGRSTADEIFEGVLLKCKNEHREKKLPFLCNIAANAPFVNTSSDQLHYLIGVAETITYRQLCFVALVGRKDEFNFDTKLLRPGKLEEAKISKNECQFILRELYQLGPYTHSLLDYENFAGTTTYEHGGAVRLTEIGSVAFELMGLKAVPQTDLSELAHTFQAK